MKTHDALRYLIEAAVGTFVRTALKFLSGFLFAYGGLVISDDQERATVAILSSLVLAVAMYLYSLAVRWRDRQAEPIREEGEGEP